MMCVLVNLEMKFFAPDFQKILKDWVPYYSLKSKVVSAWDWGKILRCTLFGPTVSKTLLVMD